MFRPIVSLTAAAALSLAALGMSNATGDMVGKDMPDARPVNIGGVAAESFDDFIGEAVLVEFFAYW